MRLICTITPYRCNIRGTRSVRLAAGGANHCSDGVEMGLSEAQDVLGAAVLSGGQSGRGAARWVASCKEAVLLDRQLVQLAACSAVHALRLDTAVLTAAQSNAPHPRPSVAPLHRTQAAAGCTSTTLPPPAWARQQHATAATTLHAQNLALRGTPGDQKVRLHGGLHGGRMAVQVACGGRMVVKVASSIVCCMQCLHAHAHVHAARPTCGHREPGTPQASATSTAPPRSASRCPPHAARE